MKLLHDNIYQKLLLGRVEVIMEVSSCVDKWISLPGCSTDPFSSVDLRVELAVTTITALRKKCVPEFT